MYHRILMAYDGSREGRRALLDGGDIAHLMQAEIHLLAVMPVPSGLFLAEELVPKQLLEEEKARYRAILDEGIQTLRAQGYNAHGHLTCGEPVEEIVATARELQADLIILGHRQHTAFASRWWKGSVGASLLEQAPCSILVVIVRT